jgi:hypothetical protein
MAVLAAVLQPLTLRTWCVRAKIFPKISLGCNVRRIFGNLRPWKNPQKNILPCTHEHTGTAIGA